MQAVSLSDSAWADTLPHVVTPRYVLSINKYCHLSVMFAGATGLIFPRFLPPLSG